MAQLTGMPQVLVGHATDAAAQTGCTVILCPGGATAGVAVRGGAPGTRETDLLRPGNLVEQVQAILLTGGSAFGLAAADGVMRWLYERGLGFATGVVNVPIVPAAVIFDLGVGDPTWPDAAMGYAACESAQQESLAWGAVGAGTGATVGKLLGPAQASRGGIGMVQVLAAEHTVTAIVAVNAFGHVIDPQTSQILAGPRLPDGSFADTVQLMLAGALPKPSVENTTIGCVITTARLDKAACNRIAGIAHDGLARTIRPVHTQADGDTIFALSVAPSDAEPADSMVIGVAAVEAVAQAVMHAVRAAEQS
ncbi:MAG: P1 family peptidase [Chloroflexi bacterium]|nr:P1 family peptidase [Chloroflexota bacterium]